MRAGVIGSPISHSLSPFIFNFVARAEGYPIDYQSFEVKANDGKCFLESLKKKKDFLGLNITLPLKELFLEEIDFLSPEVKALGALNVLHFKDSKINGMNTDIIGIQKTFEGQNFSVEGKTCLLFGAGGAAKAVAYVLGTLKAKKVFVYNRSDKGHELLSNFSTLFPTTSWHSITTFDDEILKLSKFDLIINSTPVGMTGKESGGKFFGPLEKLMYSNNALAFDLIYTPELTDFLTIARTLGISTVGGLGMLIDQALATWKIWIGNLKNEKELHQKLRDFLKGILKLRYNQGPIYLTGFMGVGKSSVAIELSRLLGRDVLDADKLIESSASMEIVDIFALKGEVFFRGLEHDVLIELSSTSKNSVIALGGGALMNDESFQAINRSGFLVYLNANEETLIERITNQNHIRPMLANLSQTEKQKKILELLSLRKKIYEKAAIHIQTDQLSIQDVAYEIVSSIGRMEEWKNGIRNSQ